jgi:hypothetical protein
MVFLIISLLSLIEQVFLTQMFQKSWIPKDSVRQFSPFARLFYSSSS